MFRIKLILLTLFVSAVFCTDNTDTTQTSERTERRKKCLRETKNLVQNCCRFPLEDFSKIPEECKSGLEGLEGKQGLDRYRTLACIRECSFKAVGILKDGDLVDTETMKKVTKQHLTNLGQEDLETTTNEAIEYCLGKINDIKETLKNTPIKTLEDGQANCSRIPTEFVNCIAGYVTRNCPETKMTKTDECTTMKTTATSMDDCMKN